MVADDHGEILGLVHTILGHDPEWGALVDNLHVTHRRKRTGIGSQLLGVAAAEVIDRTPGSGLHLWVLEQNFAGRAFYDARGRQVHRTRPRRRP